MKIWRALALCGLLAMTTAAAGCARLGLIFENSQANANATVSFVVTDADTMKQLAATKLTATDQSISYLLNGFRKTGKKVSPRNLQVEATYDDGAGNTSTLSTGVFTLGARETKYVIVDNAGGTPSISVSTENTSGVTPSTWEFLPH